MKKLFTLVALAGLTFSTLGCAESKPPAPVTPAPADAPAAADSATPAEPAPPVEEKK